LERERVFEGYYDVKEVWRRESLERLEKLRPEVEEGEGGGLGGTAVKTRGWGSFKSGSGRCCSRTWERS
jgi:hypothetical protein